MLTKESITVSYNSGWIKQLISSIYTRNNKGIEVFLSARGFFSRQKRRASESTENSHPVGYRRGRWATNNSMCAYKLIRLRTHPLLLSPIPLVSSSRPSTRPRSNSSKFLLRLPWRRERRRRRGRRITWDCFGREWNASEFTARFNIPAEPRAFIRLLPRTSREREHQERRKSRGMNRNSGLTEFVAPRV